MKNYTQVEVKSDDKHEMICWIDPQYAVKGKRVSFLDVEGIWTITSVYGSLASPCLEVVNQNRRDMSKVLKGK